LRPKRFPRRRFDLGAALRQFLVSPISALKPGVKLQWVKGRTPAGRDWWTLKSSKPSIAAPVYPSPVVTTPTATAILETEWSERFYQTTKGRWRKRTKHGIEGSMSWVQEMLVRSVAQKNPNVLPTPEACEEMMGFPAGWTDLSVPNEKLAMVPKTAKQVWSEST
jgi:hypothetical protein